jgi:hypothetical protein
MIPRRLTDVRIKQSYAAGGKRRGARWPGPAKFVLVALFTFFLFWLVQAMVAHRFFSGGSMNGDGRVTLR